MSQGYNQQQGEFYNDPQQGGQEGGVALPRGAVSRPYVDPEAAGKSS